MLIPKFSTVYHAVLRILKAVLRNKPLFVHNHTAQHRVNICRTKCGYLDGHTDQCSLCACFVGVKAQFATERCPRGKWHRELLNHRL